MKKYKLDTIILVSIGIILFIILGFIFYISLKQRDANKRAIKEESKKEADIRKLTPSINPILTLPPSLTPDQSKSTYSRPPVKYDRNKTQLLLEKLDNKIPLSEEDEKAKEKIINAFPEYQYSGVIYESSNVIIDYTQSADAIQVEITTIDIDKAKQEAVDWLTKQGLSSEAICNIPVSFYLNYNISEQLRGSNTTFSPLAPNCK